jgi:glutaredoxin 3
MLNDNLPKNPKQAQVEIYSKDYCPYCVAAMNLLTQKGVGFSLIDITHDSDLQNQMLTRANPRKTVPQIFIDGKGVGGFDDIKKLDSEGKLESLLFPRGR